MLRFDTLTTGARFDRSPSRSTASRCSTKKAPPYSVELDLGHLPRTAPLARGRLRRRAASMLADGRDPGQRRPRTASPSAWSSRSGEALQSRACAPRPRSRCPRGETSSGVELYLQRDAGRDPLPAALRAAARAAQGGGAHLRARRRLSRRTATRPRTWSSSTRRGARARSTSSSSSSTPPCSTARAGRSPGSARRLRRQRGRREAADRPLRAGDRPADPRRRRCSTSRPRWRTASTRRSRRRSRFFQEMVTPKDRAAVITFNDQPDPGGEVHQRRQGAGGRPRRPQGRARHRPLRQPDLRPLLLQRRQGAAGPLLLSDGKDEGSRFSFEDALEYARRAGVTIYADRPRADEDEDDAKKLSRSSPRRPAAGPSSSPRPRSSTAIYAAIQEELRSQYLIAYQSTSNGRNDPASARST